MNRIIDDLRAALERGGIIQSKSHWVGSFAFGLGVGLVAGATTALLLAPQAGPDTRRRLGSTAKELAGRTAGLVDKAKGTVNQLTSTAQKAKQGRNDVPVS